jgi:hypothetical protein
MNKIIQFSKTALSALPKHIWQHLSIKASINVQWVFKDASWMTKAGEIRPQPLRHRKCAPTVTYHIINQHVWGVALGSKTVCCVIMGVTPKYNHQSTIQECGCVEETSRRGWHQHHPVKTKSQWALNADKMSKCPCLRMHNGEMVTKLNACMTPLTKNPIMRQENVHNVRCWLITSHNRMIMADSRQHRWILNTTAISWSWTETIVWVCILLLQLNPQVTWTKWLTSYMCYPWNKSSQ